MKVLVYVNQKIKKIVFSVVDEYESKFKIYGNVILYFDNKI